jgi:hypothetical protein
MFPLLIPSPTKTQSLRTVLGLALHNPAEFQANNWATLKLYLLHWVVAGQSYRQQKFQLAAPKERNPKLTRKDWHFLEALCMETDKFLTRGCNFWHNGDASWDFNWYLYENGLRQWELMDHILDLQESIGDLTWQ